MVPIALFLAFLVVEKFFPYTSGTTPSPSAHIFPIIKTP